MSVTQDYKILTLTWSEYHEVRRALAQRVEYLKDVWVGDFDDEVIAPMLADAQSALAKVQA